MRAMQRASSSNSKQFIHDVNHYRDRPTSTLASTQPWNTISISAYIYPKSPNHIPRIHLDSSLSVFTSATTPNQVDALKIPHMPPSSSDILINYPPLRAPCSRPVRKDHCRRNTNLRGIRVPSRPRTMPGMMPMTSLRLHMVHALPLLSWLPEIKARPYDPDEQQYTRDGANDDAHDGAGV